MSHLMSHRRARHSLLLGCALAALAAPASAAPGTAPKAAPKAAPTATSADVPPAPRQAENAAAPLDIAVPAGWEPLPEQAARITIELNTELLAEPPVPDLPFTAQARTWRGPDAGLVVSWLQAGAPAQFPSKAARALLDHVRATPVDAALDPGDTKLVSWNEAVTQGVAEGELTWQHLANQTTTLSRALVYATADGRPAMVRADCVIPAIDAAALAAPRAACERALDSLTLTVPAARLASLDALPPASPEALAPGSASPAAGAPAGQVAGKPAGSMPPAPSLRAPGPGSDTVMIIPPSDSEKRSPPWLLLLGGLVLAAGLYLTLRSRRAAGRADDDGDQGDDRQARGETGDEPDGDPDDKPRGHPGDRGTDEGLS